MSQVILRNKHYGESRENRYSECQNCCFCDRAAPLTWNERVSIQAFLKDPSILSIPEDKDWQKEVDKRVQDSMASTYDDDGQRYGYRQIIHRKCLSILTVEESMELRARNRNNIYIPSQNTRGVVLNLDYRECVVPTPRKEHPLRYKYDPFTGNTFMGYDDEILGVYHAPDRGLYRCIKCNDFLDIAKPGMCYASPKDRKTLEYIHFLCYEKEPLTTYQPPFPSIPTCSRCDAILDMGHPGLSYPDHQDELRIRYLHFLCYEEIVALSLNK
jgi:hypothetical protein